MRTDTSGSYQKLRTDLVNPILFFYNKFKGTDVFNNCTRRVK